MTRWYVCGSYREFRAWRYAHAEIAAKNIIYVSDSYRLHGVSGEVRIVRLSSFYDWNEEKIADVNYCIGVIRANPNVTPHEGILTTHWEWK